MIIRHARTVDEVEFAARWRFLLLLLMSAMVVLVMRAAYLQVINNQFLQKQGDLRHVGVMPVPAHRGRIVDRNGELLAISSPVKSVWGNPKEFEASPQEIAVLANMLGMPVNEIKKRVADEHRGFSYLKRRISPEIADQVLALGIPGIYADREYRRYYPVGEVTSHVVGFTNIDDRGQEGIELAYDNMLKGVSGARRIMRDGKRRIIEDVASVSLPVPGKDIRLTIDQRMQYLAYRELKKAVISHRAKSGSLVLLDAKNGDVLAMVNQPSFNPNANFNINGGFTRNRAITDVFEPGSTIKPFGVACAMELGQIRPETVIDTSPGQMHVGPNLVKDVHNYGVLDVARILQKSSNVGMTKIALNLPSRKFWAFYNNLGFGQALDTGFPGEAHGHLPDYQSLRAFSQATLSFGYGVSSSTLQLARAYLTLANEGVMPMVGLVKREDDKAPEMHRIMSVATANSVRTILESVVSREGTALKASVPGFRVAGKTGTVKKTGARGYEESVYMSLFAGMAPASDPRLVMVVMIDEPSAGEYYGGAVAAPVFSSVMEGALRMLNVAPDQALPAPVITASK
jgi:cell division protein FtsI (penicillin-binding protein 3)